MNIDKRDSNFIVLFAIFVLVVYVWVGASTKYNSNDTVSVVVWRTHDLGYVADTVDAWMWWPSGDRYFVRYGNGKELFCDKEPRILKEGINEKR